MAVAPVIAPEGFQAAALCAEQIFVTFCEQGDSVRNQPGYQVRAASTSDAELLKFALDNSAYELPLDLWGTQLTTRQAPRRLALAVAPGNRLALIHTAYLPQDTCGRSGSYFTHLLVYPQLTALQALQTWGSPDWQTSYPRGASKQLQPFSDLPRSAILNDQTLTAFLNDGSALLADRELGTLVYPERLHGNVPRKRDLLRQTLEGWLRSQEAARLQGARSHFYMQAEPGLTALLLYGVCRLLPPSWVRGLTFSTYENAHSALRRYKLTHAIGTFVSDRKPKGLEPELTAVRGFGLDTLQPERSSMELKGQSQPIVDDLLDLAARGEFKRITELLRYCDVEQVSLAGLSASQEVHTASQRLLAGNATFADLQALRRTPGGRQIHDKHEATIWKLVREWSLTSAEVRQEYAELLRKRASEIKSRAAQELAAGAPTWQQQWDLLKYALEGKKKTLRQQFLDIVESGGDLLRQIALSPLQLALLKEWRGLQQDPSDFPEPVRLLLVPQGPQEIDELQRANAPKEWLALALHQGLAHPATQAAALQHLRDAGHGLLRSFCEQHQHLPESQQAQVTELFRQRRDEESPEFFSRLRKGGFPLPAELLALVGPAAGEAGASEDSGEADSEPAGPSEPTGGGQPAHGQQTQLFVIAGVACMALVVAGLLLLLSHRESRNTSPEHAENTEIPKDGSGPPTPTPKEPEKPKVTPPPEEKPKKTEPPKEPPKPGNSGKPAENTPPTLTKPTPQPLPRGPHPEAVAVRMLVEVMHKNLDLLVRDMEPFFKQHEIGPRCDKLKTMRTQLVSLMKGLDGIFTDTPTDQTRKTLDDAGRETEKIRADTVAIASELHWLCNLPPRPYRPAGSELQDDVKKSFKAIQDMLCQSARTNPHELFHEFLVEALEFEARVKCHLSKRDASEFQNLLREYLKLTKRHRPAWDPKKLNAHSEITARLIEYLVTEGTQTPGIPRSSRDVANNIDRLRKSLLDSSWLDNTIHTLEALQPEYMKPLAALNRALSTAAMKRFDPRKLWVVRTGEPASTAMVRVTELIRDDIEQFKMEMAPFLVKQGQEILGEELQSSFERIQREAVALRRIPAGADDAITRGQIEEIVRGIVQTSDRVRRAKAKVYEVCRTQPPPYPTGKDGVVAFLNGLLEQARRQSAQPPFNSGFQKTAAHSFLSIYLYTRFTRECELPDEKDRKKWKPPQIILDEVLTTFQLATRVPLRNHDHSSMFKVTERVIKYMVDDAAANARPKQDPKLRAKENRERLRTLLHDIGEDLQKLDGRREMKGWLNSLHKDLGG